MSRTELSLPELAALAATRGMLGMGIGMLVAKDLRKRNRRAIGWILIGVGVLSTSPLVATVIERRTEHDDGTGDRGTDG